MHRIISNDWTFITQNGDDFRPRQGSASRKPCYVGVPLHAGLVCLNLPDDSTIVEQKLYFQACLEYMVHMEDLASKLLEVSPRVEKIGQVECAMSDFPII